MSMQLAREDRQRKAEGGSPAFVLSGPQSPAVGLDDRTADREPHSHAVLLSREEGLEGILGIAQSAAAIGDFDSNIVDPLASRTDRQKLWHLHRRVHRLDSIA